MGGARHFELVDAVPDAVAGLSLVRRVVETYPTRIEEIRLGWQTRRPEPLFLLGAPADAAIVTARGLAKERIAAKAWRARGLHVSLEEEHGLVAPMVIGTLGELRGLALLEEPTVHLDARLRFDAIGEPRLDLAVARVGDDWARLQIDTAWEGATGGYNEVALQLNTRMLSLAHERGACQLTISVNYKTCLQRWGLDDPWVDEADGDATDLARRIARAAGVEIRYLGTG